MAHLPIIPTLADGFARRITYLRVSLTDRCNYRCVYCMPEEGVELLPRADVLTFEELERVVAVFAGLGVRRVRLTGGEPTVRKHVDQLVARLAALAGIDEVVMTSNGHLLAELAAPLHDAGLREVNVSLDTLDRDRFRALTRRGDLDRVLAGIDAALTVGLKVKINAVVLRGQNDDEIPALCAWAWDRGVVPRFIEHMPMSAGLVYREHAHVGADEIRRRVATAFASELEPASHGGVAGPARYLRLRSTGRELGIISAMSEHFCDACNRLRLTSVGDLHACLGYDDATALRPILRDGGSDDDLRAAIAGAVTGKRAGHGFGLTGVGGPRTHMVSIGG